jgi:hypothetical protein
MAAKLTKAQKAALDVLPQKQRMFVLAYIGSANGVGAAAAREAGYAHPKVQGSRLLTFPRVRRAVELMRAPAERKHIASRDDRLRFYTEMMNKEGVAERDRLRAAQLLGMVEGDFIERSEVRHQGAVVNIELTPERAAEIAREGDDR